MIECSNCHCYLSDWEINASKYTDKYCLVCRPDTVADIENGVLIEENKGINPVGDNNE